MVDLSRAFVGGRWLATTHSFLVRNPATGDAILDVADCGEDEATQAVTESMAAFSVWKKETAYERGRVLSEWNRLIRDHQDALARVMTSEMGKPIRESRGEVIYAAGFVEWYAHEATRVYQAGCEASSFRSGR